MPRLEDGTAYTIVCCRVPTVKWGLSCLGAEPKLLCSGSHTAAVVACPLYSFLVLRFFAANTVLESGALVPRVLTVLVLGVTRCKSVSLCTMW